jgi:hypothetical protein
MSDDKHEEFVSKTFGPNGKVFGHGSCDKPGERAKEGGVNATVTFSIIGNAETVDLLKIGFVLGGIVWNGDDTDSVRFKPVSDCFADKGSTVYTGNGWIGDNADA